MKNLVLFAVIAIILFCPNVIRAQEVTLVAPGGMKCPMDRMAPDFEKAIGHPVKATIGSGGATHKQVVAGDPFDVPVVQPPYQERHRLRKRHPRNGNAAGQRSHDGGREKRQSAPGHFHS